MDLCLDLIITIKHILVIKLVNESKRIIIIKDISTSNFKDFVNIKLRKYPLAN